MQKLQRFKYKYANGNKIHKGESGYKPSKINLLGFVEHKPQQYISLRYIITNIIKIYIKIELLEY